MGETVLVKADLAPDLVEAGRALLRGLDAQGLVFDAALWLLNEGSGNWHLVLSRSSVRKTGSLELYSKVNRLLTKLDLQAKIWIGMVSIIDLRSPIVQSLRAALGTTGSVDGVRLDNAMVGSVRVPACLVYRVSSKQRLDSVPRAGMTIGRDQASSKPTQANRRLAPPSERSAY